MSTILELTELQGQETPAFSEGTPSIRMVLPHLLAIDSIWTTELELEGLEMAELCEDYALECERDSIHKHRSSNLFRMISMLCSGSAAIIPHLQNVSTGASSIVVSVVATSALVAGVVQSVFGFEKGAASEITAAIQLREISKEIRLQISKPVSLRWVDPYAVMIGYEERFSEIVRTISPKIVNNDIKGRIKTARRARMKNKKSNTRRPLT